MVISARSSIYSIFGTTDKLSKELSGWLVFFSSTSPKGSQHSILTISNFELASGCTKFQSIKWAKENKNLQNYLHIIYFRCELTGIVSYVLLYFFFTSFAFSGVIMPMWEIFYTFHLLSWQFIHSRIMVFVVFMHLYTGFGGYQKAHKANWIWRFGHLSMWESV